jgi:uncharacterized membrane protein/glutaredoxin
MITVTLYSRKDCDLCTQVKEQLVNIQKDIPHRLVEFDIDSDPSHKSSMQEQIPVVHVGPYILRYPFTEQELRVSLGAASDRHRHLEELDDRGYKKRIARGRKISGADRFSYWFSQHYMLLLNVLVFLYVGLPFLAPALMEANLTAPAKVIYAVYSPLCHQLSFRSVFLFGEQPFYPRAMAGVNGLQTYEDIIGQQDINIMDARRFTGNPVVGYKTALCERDLGIYGAILLFGVIFSISKRRIKAIPWYLWVVIGVLPIAIDGLSQLPGMVTANLPAWIPMRESTPALRFITGGLFGFMTAWFLYPMIEEMMRDTYKMLARKIHTVQQLDQQVEIGSDAISAK